MTVTTIEALWLSMGQRSRFDAATGCLRWTGAMSQSGYRGVFYPVLRLGGRKGKMWRVNRLALCLAEVESLDPTLTGVALTTALEEVNRRHRHRESSHECDEARCVLAAHLRWRGHRDNVQDQAARRRGRKSDAA